MVIVGDRSSDGGGDDTWPEEIAERVRRDLVAAVDNATMEMVGGNGVCDEMKWSFVARVGKVVFQGWVT
jgi:hypothetical protein